MTECTRVSRPSVYYDDDDDDGDEDDVDDDDDDDDDGDDDEKPSPGRLVITNLSSSAGMQPACALNIY